jgi:hypothetical protein
LLLYSSNLTLGVSQLAGYLLHQLGSIKVFSGAVAGEEWKTSARGFFRTHILYFIYLTCIVLYQKPKKIESLVVVISLLLVHHAVP